MSYRLNDVEIIQKVYESIPHSIIPFVVKDLPLKYLDKLLSFVSQQLEQTPHLEFHLTWILETFTQHSRYLKENRLTFMPYFRNLQKGIVNQNKDLSKVYDLTFLFFFSLSFFFIF